MTNLGEHEGPETEPPASRPPSPWVVPAAIAAVVVLVLGAGSVLLRRAESEVNKVALADEAKSVTAVEARATGFQRTRRYVGTLEPWLQAKVGPQLASGFVDTVLVRPGAFVARGAVLATLDCRNASTASRVTMHQARALEAQQKATIREGERMRELLDGGFVSPNEVDQQQARASANEAQIQALLAQASSRSLEVNDCVLRAPFDGEIASRYVDPGAYVRPGNPIVELVDRSVIRLAGDVPEIDFAAVAPKTAVKLRLLATGKELTGEIGRRAPGADRSTRTVHFEIDLPNAERDIPVGTTAEITVAIGEPIDAVEIPLLAASVRGKTATVFAVQEGIAKKLTVAVLGERGGSLFVEPEPLRGARVVTQGRSLLANGDRVTAKIEPLEEEEEAEGKAP